MSQIEAVAREAGTAMFARWIRAAVGRVRIVVIICAVLICGSFASAALIQMRLDRSHALSQAAVFAQRRAQEMATDLSAALDRYAAIGAAFAAARTSAETSAALSEAGGAPLKNVAVFDRTGQLMSEMRGAPTEFLPLGGETFAYALHGRAIVPSHDGHSIAMLFAVLDRVVAVQIDPALLLTPAGMEDGLLANPSGRILAHGAHWNEGPDSAAVALGDAGAATRIVELADGARLISLRHVDGWPLSAGASIRVEEALGAWYGALPLYFFFILGPAIAGATLAVVFVRVFERHARAAAAVKALRSTRPGEARLLVRLARAERRAADTERAKERFVAQMSHELRTPLNAIIGFADVIEAGIFGGPGHPKYVEYARDISGAGRELHAKIGSVLEFAALGGSHETSRSEEAAGAVDVAKIARMKIEERAAVARARGLKLVLSLPDSAPARTDAEGLSRILGHLLDNAFSYTPKGGVVRLELRTDAREVVIAVRDTGIGFLPGEKARAGEPFLRFPRPGSPGGMGLGLAIATGLARRMGAPLSLLSIPGQGTLAELRLAAGKPA
jgi:signal transduction histidine kinase